MKHPFLYPFSCLLAVLVLVFSCANESATTATEQAASDEPVEVAAERIVSLNGSLTELLFDLGYGEQLVGVDVTSTYPAAATELPGLGHIGQLNTEALLQLKPTMVIVDAKDAEKPALQQLQAAGIKIIPVTLQSTLDNAVLAARALQPHLDLPTQQLAILDQRIKKETTELASLVAASGESPRVLFIYARGTGRLMVGGSETSAAKMIALAGGENAITSFTDFAALTPESLLQAAPDVILLFESGLASLDGLEGLSQIPGMTQVPAYQNGRIIAMDGHYLLGFGPRAAQAAIELAEQLHTNAKAL